jgi:hypothetical protein
MTTPTPEEQNYQPTVETILGKLARPGALFAHDEMGVMVRAIEALTAAHAAQARAHVEHLALCAEASAKANRERLQLEDQVARQHFLLDELRLQLQAAQDDARSAREGGSNG